jgi:hypothetical protein
VLRSIKDRLRNRLRALWEQCDLFDVEGFDRHAGAQTTPSTSQAGQRTTVASPPSRPRVRTKTIVAPPASVPQGHPSRAMPKTHPQDVIFVHRLTEAFAKYNAELFGGTLRPVAIRVSRRMKNRLGHYMAASKAWDAEIAISRGHIRRDGWDEVLHTLIHEMVHQWQDESGLPIDHGQHFRRKAREVGITARATRVRASRD